LLLTINITTMEQESKEFRLYGIFTGIFCTALVMVPVLGSKFIAVGSLALNGSTLVFPITFIFNDILTEVYGYKRSRKIIWTGMGCQIFATLMIVLVGVWPAASFWTNQTAFQTVLGFAPRATLASLVAYFFSEFSNSLVLSKMKYWQKGKRGFAQGWRFIASTIVGEFFDSIVFMSIGFVGVLAVKDILITIVTIWIAKVLYEVIALLFSIRFANYVKRVERVDKIDSPDHTNYNPFSVFFSNNNFPEKYQ
jgi:queuosine precursor transporter